MKAFSLIELLVTVSVLGILAGMSIVFYESYKEQSRQAQAQVELQSIAFAVTTLEMDTGLLPGAIQGNGPCVINASNNEFSVNSCQAGLYCATSSFPNWRGPYLTTGQLRDPWGTMYQYDQDYDCRPAVRGCNKSGWAKVVATAGPDKIVNNYDSRESALVICYGN